MSEIKTACRGTSRLIEAATMTYEEYLNLHTQGAEELRAAYEALQKENAAQAKRIAELENQISIQMNFGERMIINSDGDVVGDDTGRVVAKFSHCNETESFCEAANFKYSASKNGE